MFLRLLVRISDGRCERVTHVRKNIQVYNRDLRVLILSYVLHISVTIPHANISWWKQVG
jgi:hypothetical protein